MDSDLNARSTTAAVTGETPRRSEDRWVHKAETSSLLEIALNIAASGVPVFPCSALKRPSIGKDKGGNGFHDASTDPDRIRELWQLAGPAAQLIGAPTGAASGMDALDIDPRHGADDWRTANIHQLPETRVHATMSGGEHWFFRHVDGVRNGASKVAPGIDVRGSGGYVIMPPSTGYAVIHERGDRPLAGLAPATGAEGRRAATPARSKQLHDPGEGQRQATARLHRPRGPPGSRCPGWRPARRAAECGPIDRWSGG
jgi:hypothetical protein